MDKAGILKYHKTKVFISHQAYNIFQNPSRTHYYQFHTIWNPWGEKTLDKIANYGIDISCVQKDLKRPTGIVDVNLTDKGIPSYKILEDVAYDSIDFNDSLKEHLKSRYDFFCFGSLIQRFENNQATLNLIFKYLNAKEVFYDVNIRKDYYSRYILDASLRRSTIFKLNDEEVGVVSSTLYEAALSNREFVEGISKDYSIHTICITSGSKGCEVYHDGDYREIDGYSVEVMDTVGAGDAFSAAFIDGYSKGKDVFECAKLGNYLGAYVASCRGAVPDYSESIMRYLEGNVL